MIEFNNDLNGAFSDVMVSILGMHFACAVGVPNCSPIEGRIPVISLTSIMFEKGALCVQNISMVIL